MSVADIIGVTTLSAACLVLAAGLTAGLLWHNNRKGKRRGSRPSRR